MTTTNEPNQPTSHNEIARLARQIWEQEGRQPGHDLDHWLLAERQLLSAGNQGLSYARGPSATIKTASPGTRKTRRFPAPTTNPARTTAL